jgi:hypothetical protein
MIKGFTEEVLRVNLFSSPTRGLSLLEVVLSVFIFLIVLIISLGFWTNFAKWMKASRSQMLASHVAEKIMAEALETDFDEVDALEGKGSFPVKVTLRGQEQNYNIGYVVHVEEIEPFLKSVSVKVSYGSGRDIFYEVYVKP